MVKIKFFGTLAEAMPHKDEQGFWNQDAAGRTVADILALTSLGTKNIRYSIYVNNVQKRPEYLLADGDVLTIMPLLAGG